MEWKSLIDQLPPQGVNIMVETDDNRKMVQIHGDTAFTWNTAYPEGKASVQFCKVYEIQKWRLPTGFDY